VAASRIVAVETSTVVLLHSPLVGPGTWRPVGARLAARGHRVVVPDLRPALDGPAPFQPAIAARVARTLADGAPDAAGGPGRPVVLIGHSGAGPLLPWIARALDRPVAALGYVDAMLPAPGRSWWDGAPPALAETLRGLARDGLLPPWDEWFPAGTVAGLLPDPQVYAAFRAELPRLPVAYFDERGAPGNWAGAAGYLLLSEGYRDQAEAARRAGLPVVEELDHHLAPLTAPEAVTAALVRLLAALD
jgi:acetyl esterase/lipase